MTAPTSTAATPRRRTIDLRSKKVVLLGLLALVLIIFAAGMAAAWHVRDHTFCTDGKPPIQEKSGALLPTVYRCHNGEITTLNQG